MAFLTGNVQLSVVLFGFLGCFVVLLVGFVCLLGSE